MKRIGLAAMLISGMALAQTAPQAPPKKDDSPLQSSTAARSLFKSAGKRAEDKILPLVLHRTDVSGDARTRVEIQLDLLVIGRWMASLKPGSDDSAACQFLRLIQLQAVQALLQKQFSDSPGDTFNTIQQNAIRELHQLTFDLPKSADAGKLDEVCRNVGVYVLEISTGQATNTTKIPPMRPASLPQAPADAQIAKPRVVTPEVSDDPAKLIPNLTVSQPLRQQLLLTLDATAHPEKYGISDQDVLQLKTVLREAIDIAAGLAGNAGVAGDERMALERQLTESLALYADPRLRDLAREHIGDMSRYRQILGSITRLKLSEANYKLLAPAFEFAQKNSASAKQVVASVERFVALSTAFEKDPAVLTYPANPAVARSLAKPYEDSRRGFDAARSAFLSDAQSLGTGNIGGTSPGDLDTRLEEMQISLDVVDALCAMPSALDIYSSYKPKPIGGLERRIAKEASVAASPGKGPIRQEALGVLKELVKVAITAQDLEQVKLDGANLDIYRDYTSKSPDDLTGKWKANVAEIATEAAAGAPLDEGRIERNERLVSLLASLPTIVAVEAELKNAAVLDRWADWAIDPRVIDQVVYPYRSAAATAFLSFLADNTDGMKAWPTAQKERRATMNLLIRSIGGANQLPEQPNALQQQCAKLLTPFASAPYATQRIFGLAEILLLAADTDAATTAQLRQLIAQRLQQP